MMPRMQNCSVVGLRLARPCPARSRLRLRRGLRLRRQGRNFDARLHFHHSRNRVGRLLGEFGMTREKHTPGPWEYDMERGTHDCVIFQAGAQHSDHVKKYGYINPDGGGVIGSSEWIWVKEGDARLIAAAPDLLEALKVADNLLMQTLDWNNGWECSENDLLGGIRAAIAKAEGRS